MFSTSGSYPHAAPQQSDSFYVSGCGAQPLHSPFEMAGCMPGFVPTSQHLEAPIDTSMPCTRARIGSGGSVLYAELDRGTAPGNSDSGATSGGDTLHLPMLKQEDDQSSGGCKEKKKVGRPITYRGDVNSKNLSEAERRRIKRRVANRESARRVRQKRQDTMEEMQQRMEAMTQQITTLTSHLQDVDSQKATLLQQLETMRSRWMKAVNTNRQLQGDAAGPGGQEPSSSCPSSATEADLELPSTSPPSEVPAPFDATQPTLLPMPTVGAGAVTSGVITSGQPPFPGSGLPASAAAGGVSCFRHGVTITSAMVNNWGAASTRPHQVIMPAVPPQPAVSLAPAPAGACARSDGQDVPGPQQDAGGHDDMLNWFLSQSSLEPVPSLKTDPAMAWDDSLLKGF